MKDTRSAVRILMIALIAVGVLSLFVHSSDPRQSREYLDAVKAAQDYEERGLYQLAIEQYEKAISAADSEELRNKVQENYERLYRETNDSEILAQYLAAVESASAAFPENEEYLLTLANLYVEDEQEQTAYRALSKAIESGMDSDRVYQKLLDVRYSFETSWTASTSFLPCSNGLYAVQSFGRWDFMDSSGSLETEAGALYLSQPGEEGIYICCTEEDGAARNLIIDENRILRGKLTFVPQEARTYSEGYIAIRYRNQYAFYDSLGDKLIGSFLSAGNFLNGMAPVCRQTSQWYFIDTSGNEATSETFEDIRLAPDGSWQVLDRMLAKRDGKYHLYDDAFQQVGTFACDDVDMLTADGLIAFKQDEKWGYVNTQGEVVIEPAFENARSFSNGLAAVCENGWWGFIDTSGRLVIACQFLGADYFTEAGSCMVETDVDEWRLLQLKVHT